jgi:hypothetical protein
LGAIEAPEANPISSNEKQQIMPNDCSNGLIIRSL